MKILGTCLFLFILISCSSKQESRTPSASGVDSQDFSNEPFIFGFNQGWIFDRYEWQFTKKGFDEDEFRRVFKLSKAAYAPLVRIWLFPGQKPLFLDVQSAEAPQLYKTTNQNSEYLRYIERMLEIADQEGVKLNLTLFNGVDAHLPIREEHYKHFLNDLLNDKNSRLDDFLSGPLEKVLDLINSRKSYREVVTQMDIANEINAYTTVFGRNGIGFSKGRTGANEFICKIYDKIKSHEVGSSIQVTASLGYGNEKSDLVGHKFPWPDCVDFFDVHSYSFSGKIRGCEKMVRYAREHGKRIILGEFGQFQIPSFTSNNVQSKVTRNFLRNAKICGFSGALAWRLAEPGGTEKYLYNAGEHQIVDGKFTTDEKGNRPAYYIFQETAKQMMDEQNELFERSRIKN